MIKKDLNGFKVLLVKYSSESTAEHEVFMKEHSVRNQEDDKPAGRTLFLINIPPWATEDSLRDALTCEIVTFTLNKEGSKNGFKSAYAVFKTSPALYKALKLKSLPPLSTPEKPIILGMQKWQQEYNDKILNQEKRKLEALAIINEYDTEEASKKAKGKNADVDDEGWTVVTKKGRHPGLSRKESVQRTLAEKAASKEKVLKNFYRHQIRQEKKDQLATLRKKAEEDKKKVLLLRQKRAFKPF